MMSPHDRARLAANGPALERLGRALRLQAAAGDTHVTLSVEDVTALAEVLETLGRMAEVIARGEALLLASLESGNVIVLEHRRPHRTMAANTTY